MQSQDKGTNLDISYQILLNYHMVRINTEEDKTSLKVLIQRLCNVEGLRESKK